MSAPTENHVDDPARELFPVALDLARAAKSGNISGWLSTRYEFGHLEDITFLLSQMVGVLVENDAIRRGVHPADRWAELHARGVDEFG